MSLCLPVSGWCPAGRAAEDGVIPDRYPLRETPTDDPRDRTERNVSEADGTLVVSGAESSPGTAFTLACARGLERPVHLAPVDRPADVAAFTHWLENNTIRTMNVAGPRESESPGIYLRAVHLLRVLLTPP
jgi:hypothetical protein